MCVCVKDWTQCTSVKATYAFALVAHHDSQGTSSLGMADGTVVIVGTSEGSLVGNRVGAVVGSALGAGQHASPSYPSPASKQLCLQFCLQLRNGGLRFGRGF